MVEARQGLHGGEVTGNLLWVRYGEEHGVRGQLRYQKRELDRGANPVSVEEDEVELSRQTRDDLGSVADQEVHNVPRVAAMQVLVGHLARAGVPFDPGDVAVRRSLACRSGEPGSVVSIKDAISSRRVRGLLRTETVLSPAVPALGWASCRAPA